MKTSGSRKLTLRKEVLRKLNEADLEQIIGGHPRSSATCDMCSSVMATCPSGAPTISCCRLDPA